MAVRATLDSQLRVLLAQQQGAGDGEDIEAVHQMRVATRKMRVALRTGESVLGENAQRLRAELSWLGGVLGPVRDLDVLCERVAEEADSLSEIDLPGFSEVMAVLQDQRSAAHADLVTGLADQRYRALLRSLAAESTTATDEKPAITSTGKTKASAGRLDPGAMLRRPLRKLYRGVKTAGPAPSAETLHELRIRAKRVRYTGEQAATVAAKPKPFTRLARGVRALQDVLGEHHDTVTAEARLRELADVLTGQPAVVVGRLVEREHMRRAACERRWPAIWAEVDRRARKL